MDAVWPGKMLAEQMAVWALPLGLIIETAIIHLMMKRPLAKSIGMAIAINLFSSIVAGVGVTLAGLAWESSIGYALYRFLGVETFNPANWIFTVSVAAFLSYYFDIKALKWFFKINLEKKDKQLFLAANIVSTLIALASIFY